MLAGAFAGIAVCGKTVGFGDWVPVVVLMGAWLF